MSNGFIPTKVNAVLAINQEQVNNNIKNNLHQISNWYDTLFYPNGFQAYIVSAGPSMEKYVEQHNLKERMEHPHRTFIVMCVKHALPRLLAMGIEPDFCVILDGREFDDESTHGHNRKKLFEKIPERTIFMIASMSHPGYANYLMTHGARVLGWHTSVDGLEGFQKTGQIREPVISGGTSSGTRCIGIATAMGIREITLIGFDSCHVNLTEDQLQEKDKKGRPKYMPVNLPIKNPNDAATPEEMARISKLTEEFHNEGFAFEATLSKRFMTTGELLAQAQDFEKIFSNPTFDFQMKVFDDGLVGHMFNNMNLPKRGFDFSTYFRKICPRKEPKKMPRRSVELSKGILEVNT